MENSINRSGCFTECGSTVLKNGDKFSVKLNGKETDYEFIGFDLNDARAGGCRYIVLKNLSEGSLTCVEGQWFNEALTGRKITCEEEI